MLARRAASSTCSLACATTNGRRPVVGQPKPPLCTAHRCVQDVAFPPPGKSEPPDGPGAPTRRPVAMAARPLAPHRASGAASRRGANRPRARDNKGTLLRLIRCAPEALRLLLESESGPTWFSPGAVRCALSTCGGRLSRVCIGEPRSATTACARASGGREHRNDSHGHSDGDKTVGAGHVVLGSARCRSGSGCPIASRTIRVGAGQLEHGRREVDVVGPGRVSTVRAEMSRDAAQPFPVLGRAWLSQVDPAHHLAAAKSLEHQLLALPGTRLHRPQPYRRQAGDVRPSGSHAAFATTGSPVHVESLSAVAQSVVGVAHRRSVWPALQRSRVRNDHRRDPGERLQ